MIGLTNAPVGAATPGRLQFDKKTSHGRPQFDDTANLPPNRAVEGGRPYEKPHTQYFNENPAVLTHERTLKLNIFGMEFRFLTNNGLFSCDKIDAASILLLEQLPALTGRLLDLGCGYGTLGIVLARKNTVVLTMSDINRIALDYAAKNAVLNQVEAEIIHSDGFENLGDKEKRFGKYDNIVLNPPIHAGKEVMYRLYTGAAAHLTPSGALYIVIHKKHGAESTMRALNEIFSECRVLYKKKGLYVLQYISAALSEK